MIYIALSFLVGILWMNFKVISISLFFLLILLIFIKKLKLPIIILIVVCPFFSNYITQTYNQRVDHEQRILMYNPKVNDYVKFKTLKVQNNFITGILVYKGKNYNFFYNNNNKTNITSLKHHTCSINGEFKFDKVPPSITLNEIHTNSCTYNDRFKFIYFHQDYIIDKIQHSGVKYPNRILALITGNPLLINADYRDKVKDIGIYHLLAVSGTHVAAIILLIHQLLVRFNTPLVIIKTMIINVLVLYAVYTDFVPSAVRAISIAILVLILPKRFRKSSIDLISIIFIMMFISNPGYVYNIGFQFSFLICFFILLSQPYLKKLTSFQSIIAITCIAQYSSIIISTYHFNQFQWIGFLSNLVFVPFYSFILFPSIICFFIMTHIVSNFEILNVYMNKIYEIHDLLLHFFLKFNNYKWFIPSLSEIYLLILLINILIAYYLLVYKKIFKSLIYFLITLIIISTLSKPSNAELTIFDVGQGDSILFKSNTNKTVLIDTGGKGEENFEFKHHNIAKYKILPSLKRRGITTIDYLIITHPHADHMGELPYIIDHVKIKNLILNSDGFPKHLLNQVHNECKKKRINIIEAKNIPQIKIDDTELEIYDTFISSSSDKNEYSIITLIKYNNRNILLMGEATKNNEDILLKKYHLPTIDILKVGHHGSRTSSSEEFIKKIQPRLSLISSGKHNKYKLPNDEVIERLKRYGSLVYDTQQNGEMTINLDKHHLNVMNVKDHLKTIAREVTQ
ncbi:DNA internalization-related competence protein ComEC/Rec2 [Staphylococcus capitis]|uniref:DNA internalization-related competence protein ComEC/Rec2 n=1 Tax=Staphylococcus capitis TaxID=29388 RepID=UPI003527C0C3